MRKKVIKQYLKKNIISYNDLINLSDDECVKVSKNYFNFLVASAQFLNIRDKDCWKIFSKYLEIDKMQYYIKVSKYVETPYYLMSASDAKILTNFVKNKSIFKAAFLNSDKKVSQLNEIHNKIKEQYNNKKLNQNNTDQEKQLIKSK